MSLRLRSVLDLPPQARARVREQPGVATVSKPLKYRNVRTEADGIAFDSKLEARRYGELLQMQTCGVIADLKAHPSFALHVRNRHGNHERIGAYEADFSYRRDEQLVVEDCKSPATKRKELYRWKRKHFEAEYGIVICEIEHRRRSSTASGVSA